MTSPPFLHLHHVHSIPILTERILPVAPIRKAPTLPHVKVGSTPIRQLTFNRLELFFNLALTTITSDNWHELNLEMVGLMFCMGRHLDLAPGLVVSTASRSGGRTTKLRLADYLKSGFAGQLGAGVAALYARELGAMYLAHTEDIDNASVAEIHRSYQRPAHSSSGTPSGKLSNRKGDFLTVNARGEFGMLEAKATAERGSAQKFMTSKVRDGAEWQIDPFVPGSIVPLGTPHGVPMSAAFIQHGVVSGLKIHQSTAGAAIHAIHLKLPPGRALPTGLSGSIIATQHFKAWWRLFNLAFADLRLPPRAFTLMRLKVGAMSFVVNLGAFSEPNEQIGSIREQGWATSTFPDMYGVRQPIFVAIEEGVFLQLLAGFTGRQAVRSEDGDRVQYRATVPTDNVSTDIAVTGSPEAIHAAVERFQAQLRERLGTDQGERDDQRDLQAWKAILSDELGGQVTTAFFREGVIAFTGIPWRRFDNKFLIIAEEGEPDGPRSQ